MRRVIRRENEDSEQLIRRFKKLVQKDGCLQDLRNHEFFLKKSLAKKRKSELARKNRRK